MAGGKVLMTGRKHETQERIERTNFREELLGGGNEREMGEKTRRACCRAWDRCRGGVDTDTTAGGGRT